MKIKQSRYSWAIFGYLPAIDSGLRDSINIAGLTALMLFFIFMYFAILKGRRPLSHGLGFLFGLTAGKFYALTGVLDPFFRNKYYWLFMEISYIMWALITVILGGLLFKDWWALRIKENYNSVIIKSPFDKILNPLSVSAKAQVSLKRVWVNVLKNIFMMFGPLLCGLAAALAVVAFPEDRNVLFVLYEGGMPVGAMAIVKLSAAYVFSFIILISLFYMFFVAVLRSKQAMQDLRTHYTFVQMFFSALFLAYGIGMGILIVFK